MFAFDAEDLAASSDPGLSPDASRLKYTTACYGLDMRCPQELIGDSARKLGGEVTGW